MILSNNESLFLWFLGCVCVFVHLLSLIIFCFDSHRTYMTASRTSPSKSQRMTAMTWHTLSSTRTERAGCSNWVSGTKSHLCDDRSALHLHLSKKCPVQTHTLTSISSSDDPHTLYSSTSFPLHSWWISISWSVSHHMKLITLHDHSESAARLHFNSIWTSGINIPSCRCHEA